MYFNDNINLIMKNLNPKKNQFYKNFKRQCKKSKKSKKSNDTFTNVNDTFTYEISYISDDGTEKKQIITSNVQIEVINKQ